MEKAYQKTQENRSQNIFNTFFLDSLYFNRSELFLFHISILHLISMLFV